MSLFDRATKWVQETFLDTAYIYLWEPVQRNLFPDPTRPSPDKAQTMPRADEAPILWLLGKTGAGKSSIIQVLTGASQAHVGNGFKSCTKTAEIFEFPSDTPLIRFLDTRGLGEPGYDPTEDIGVCAAHAGAVVVVIKVTDTTQQAVWDVLQRVRQQHPSWPLVVALTGLHETYPPNTQHVTPYPFGANGDLPNDDSPIPTTLRAAIQFQRALFSRIPGKGEIRFIPIDFTQPEDGFDDPQYGRDALLNAIIDMAPAALANRLADLKDMDTRKLDQEVWATILVWATAGAVAGGIPVPFVDTAALASVISGMLYALARFYQIELTREVFAGFVSCLGSGVLLSWLARYAGREVLKLIPVYGQLVMVPVSAAAGFALVYALGVAACNYFGHVRRNEAMPEEEIRRAFRSALDDAYMRFIRHSKSKPSEEGDPA
jgi:uncharacterized protein (DUF697 family)/energy-coupling factor transporter ATP-binding protein EcfA2